MLEFIEFHDLEQLASKNEKAFLERVEESLVNDGIDTALKLIKASGICVDVYGTSRYSKLYSDTAETIKRHQSNNNDTAQAFFEEVRLFNLAFDSFRKFRMTSNVDTVSTEYQIPAFLLSGEFFLGNLSLYVIGKKLAEVEERYPVMIQFEDQDFVPPNSETLTSRILQVYDSFSEDMATIHKYIELNGAYLGGLHTIIQPKIIEESIKHIELFSIFRKIKQNHDLWRFSNGKLIKKSDNQLFFETKNKEEYLSWIISSARYRAKRLNQMFDFVPNVETISVHPETTLLPPQQFRTVEEALDCIFVYDLLGSEHLHEKILNITLAEWLRAYSTIREEARNFIPNINIIETDIYKLSDWAIHKTKGEWISSLFQAGISRKKGSVIVDTLTFGRESKDFLDCPLIPVEDTLIILPAIAKEISPVESMISVFSNKNLDVSFKGDGLEKRIREKLTSVGIKNSDLYAKERNDEFQCDIAFKIDSDIFFVECKAFSQPQTLRGHYELCGKLTETSVQLNRIANYFEKNISEFYNVLEIPRTWKPKHFHKIILSTAMLGDATQIDQCHVVDENNFNQFLDSAYFQSHKNQLSVTLQSSEQIALQEILFFLSDPIQAKKFLHYYEEETTDIKLEEIVYSYADFVKNTPDFSVQKIIE